MPLDFLTVGAQPVAGYECLQDMGGSVFSRLWRVRAPDGSIRMWKCIDLAVGNAAVETRNLELLVKLRHPNLNTLTNYYTLADRKTLIVETEVPVKSMRERLAECKSLGLPGVAAPELMGFMHQAAEGLDFLNSPRHLFQGKQVAVYHRDLRPESLLIFKEEGKSVCKVSDFGLAKPVSDQGAQHSQGLLHFDYDPPEFYEGATAPTSDQYSLAINYYELRTGSLPFQGTMLEQLSARLNDSPNLEGASGAEKEVIRRALSRDPARRFGSCREFVEKLEQSFSDRPPSESSISGLAEARPGSVSSGPRPSGMYPRPGAPGANAPAAKYESSFQKRPQSVVTDPALPGVKLRRQPQPSEFDESQTETPRDLESLLRSVTNRSNPEPDADEEPAASPAQVLMPPQAPLEFQEKKVPLVWVVIILIAGFTAIAIVAKEFVMPAAEPPKPVIQSPNPEPPEQVP